MCPLRVVRFYGNLDFALDAIRSKQIAFVPVCKLNDPFDPYIAFETDFDDNYNILTKFVETKHPRDYKEFIRQLPKAEWKSVIESLRKQMCHSRNSCYIFSTVADDKYPEAKENLYMWGHYGNGHRGIAIEFDNLLFYELFQNNHNSTVKMHEIIYRDKVPKITCEQAYRWIMNYENITWMLHDLLFTKSCVWNKEAEWRLICWNNSTETVQKFDLLDDTITAVYIGYLVGKPHEQEFIYETRRNFPNAKIFKSNIKKGEFALEFEEL